MKKHGNIKKYLSLLLSAGMLLSTGCAEKSVTEMADKVILDCDMGFMNDDTLALSMLLQAQRQQKLNLLGITLEGGNVFIDADFESDGTMQRGSWENAQKFLEAAGHADIPVYRGSDYPSGFSPETQGQLADFYRSADYLPYCDGYGAIHAFGDTSAARLCAEDYAKLSAEEKSHYGAASIIRSVSGFWDYTAALLCASDAP